MASHDSIMRDRRVSGCSRIMLLSLMARSAASFSIPSQHPARKAQWAAAAPASARLPALRLCSSDDLPSAFDLSAELAKRSQSKSLRLRTSGPVRKTFGAFADAVGEAGAFGRFLKGLTRAVPVSRAMMLTMLCAYGAQSYAPRAAMLAGARVNQAILSGGQWHRLVSPVFLHGGFLHLASNLFSLYRVGPLVDASFGAARTLLLYLLSGVGGNLAGLWFGASRGMSIGASGAVFGMIGATGGFVLRNRNALGTYGDMLLRNAFQILMLNLFFGMRSPGIDNLAHVGGFATGLVLGVLVAPKAGSARRASPRYDYDDGLDEETYGDGAILPPWLTRAALAATVVGYALGLKEATGIAQRVVRVYGR
jgi:rhomboid protease GluP